MISAVLGVALKEVDRTRFHHTAHETARSLWQHTLAHVPSAYGKLVYLASLRNTDTGKYEHFGVPGEIDTYPQTFRAAFRRPLTQVGRGRAEPATTSGAT